LLLYYNISDYLLITYRNREITAHSATSRNDFLANIKFGGKDPANLRMVNYSPKETNALLKSISLKKGEVPGKSNIFKSVKDLLGGGGGRFVKDYDFAKAKISDPRFEIIGKGVTATTKVSVEVEVPLLNSGSSKLSFRIENYFKGVITALRERQIIQRFKALFDKKFIAEKPVAEKELKDFAAEVEREIKKEFPEILDIKLKLHEIEDMTVSENLRNVIEKDANAE